MFGQIIGAVLGSAIMGSASKSNAKTQAKSADKATAASAAAAADANEVARENLAFQREAYGDWEAAFGDIQSNLGDYYTQLDPGTFAARGQQEQQMKHQLNQTKMRQNLAQRGFGDSKYEDYMLAMSDISNSQEQARIVSSAPEQVAKQQLGFLGIGLGQGAALLGNNNQAANIGVGALGNQMSNYTSQFNNANDNNAAFQRKVWDTGAGIFGTATGSFFAGG